jgi:uncharacterized protein (DUF111 family)
MFMVTTSEGVRITDAERGLDKTQAERIAADRNAQAKEMSLKVRYEVRPFVAARTV